MKTTPASCTVSTLYIRETGQDKHEIMEWDDMSKLRNLVRGAYGEKNTNTIMTERT